MTPVGATTNETAPPLIATWGERGGGEPGGPRFRFPGGIDEGPDGRLYIADRVNNRIEVVEPDGTLVDLWGTPGSGDGELDDPYDVAVGADGRVYVTDTGNDRVQVFTADGGFLDWWGPGGAGSGTFDHPSGITAESGGVYVADSAGNRIYRFSVNGALLGSWGGTGAGEGQFAGPRDVATDPDGRVYVTDYSNGRVQRFSADGTFETTWGVGASPTGIAVADTGQVVVTHYASAAGVQVFTAAGAPVTSWNGGTNERAAIGSDGNVYITRTYEVVVFTLAGVLVTRWGVEGTDPGIPQFSLPYDVVPAPDGTFYVADSGNDRVQQIGPAGEALRAWGGLGTADGEFDDPRGVAVAPDGHVYVADSGNDRVQEFTATGDFVRSWGTTGSGPGQFTEPRSLVVDALGRVFVTDRLAHRVQRFDGDGNYQTGWGEAGSATGQFNQPKGIALGPDGDVYVADRINDRVQRFEADGTFVDQYPEPPSAYGPEDVTVDAAGGIYVGDPSRLYKLDTHGDLLWLVNVPGYSVATDAARRLYSTPVNDGVIQVRQTGTGSLASVVLSADERTVVRGDTIRYHVRVHNTGTVPLTGITLGGTPVADCAGPVADLAVGATAVVDCVHTTTAADGGTFSNQVTLSAAGLPDLPSNQLDVLVAPIARPAPLDEWGTPGTADGQFDEPGGIDVAADGTVYVADTGRGRVQHLTGTGEHLRTYASTSSFGDESVGPVDVAVTPDGNVLFAEVTVQASRMREVTPAGDTVRQWGEPGSCTFPVFGAPSCPAIPTHQFAQLLSVGSRPDGGVYTTGTTRRVCGSEAGCVTRGTPRVQQFTATGSFLNWWQPTGTDIAATADTVYTTTDDDLLAYTANGPLMLLGTTPVGADPGGVALDAAGNIYVAVTGEDRVKVYTPDRDLLTAFDAPADRVAVDPTDGTIYVLDTDAARVRRFEALTIPATVAGTVTESATDPTTATVGDPLDGMLVAAFGGPTGSTLRGTSTDPSGAYTIDVPADTYGAAFIDPTGNHHFERHNDTTDPNGFTTFAATAGETTTIDAGLSPSTPPTPEDPATISGTVTDPDGPVANAWVVAVDPVGNPAKVAVTATDGTYQLDDLTPGDWRLIIVDPAGNHPVEWWQNGTDWHTATIITLTADDTTTADPVLDTP